MHSVYNLCSCYLIKLEFSCLEEDTLQQVDSKVLLSHLAEFLMPPLTALFIMCEILTPLKKR